MKTRFTRVTSAISAAAVLLTMVQLGVSAAVVTDYNFDSQTETLNAADGGKLTSNGVEYTAVLDYAEGKSGKADGDYAYRMTYANLPHTVADARGLEIPYYPFSANSEGAVRTLEISVKYNEGTNYAHLRSYISANPSSWSWNTVVDFVSFKNGKVLVNNKDTGMAAKPNEWYRIAVEEHYNAADTRVYINGQVFNPGLSNYIFGNRWTQVLAGMDATGEAGTRDVSVMVDDIKIYDSVYAPTGEEAIDYTVTGSLNFGAGVRGFFVDNTVTVAEVLSSIDTSCEKIMLDSLEANTVKSAGTVDDGNVVIIKSADGKTFEYLYIYTSAESKIVDRDSFNESSVYTMFGDTTYAGRGVTTGIYGRGSGDYSFDMYTNGLPGNIESANRYNFMADNNVCSAESFTKEFSIGADGDVDRVKFIVRSTFTDAAGNSEYGYQEPVAFSADGTIDINGDRILTTAEFKQNQWYRVAMTVYPYECKYDLYLNNEKVITKGWLSMSDTLWDADKYDVTSLYWFQIQPVYSANENNAGTVRSGHVYVDDTITYYGGYTPSSGSEIAITTAYEVDEAAGTITVPDGTDISAFVENIDFGSATPALYADNTYTSDVQDWLSDGNVLVLTSENGLVFKYYTIKTSTDVFKVDDNINLTLTPAQGSTPAKAKATVNMYVPTAQAAKPVTMVIAAYKDNALMSVNYITDSVSGDRLLEAELDIADTNGVIVKAMLWDDGMQPYIISSSL